MTTKNDFVCWLKMSTRAADMLMDFNKLFVAMIVTITRFIPALVS